jgi:hypothetical protein
LLVDFRTRKQEEFGIEAILKKILTKLGHLENDVAEIKAQIQELSEKLYWSERWWTLSPTICGLDLASKSVDHPIDHYRMGRKERLEERCLHPDLPALA